MNARTMTMTAVVAAACCGVALGAHKAPKKPAAKEKYHEINVVEAPVGTKGIIGKHLTIVQVLDAENALATIGDGNVAWFKCPVKDWGWTDGKVEGGLGISPFEITGTKQYKTALGSTRTVNVFEYRNWDGHRELMAKRKAEQQAAVKNAKEDAAKRELDAAMRKLEEAERAEQEDKGKWRTWTAADGIHKTEAKFVSYAAGRLTLEKRDGGKITLQIGQLCKADQDFVRFRRWIRGTSVVKLSP